MTMSDYFLFKGKKYLPEITVPNPLLPNMRRVRRWGDPVMAAHGFDVNQVGTTNFQAVRCYNKATGFGAVTNFIRIERSDIVSLYNLQRPDWAGYTTESKMNWLCKFRGTIYMYDKETDHWMTAPQIRWGTLTLGGNLVQVERYETISVIYDGLRQDMPMARLIGFRKSDWPRPLDDLLAEGLVHRCYCAYKNNQFGDSPKGIVYSPFWSMLDWDFTGNETPDALYIPTIWLEDV